MSLTHLIPWLLDWVWREYTTRDMGLQPTENPPRGIDRLTATVLEHRHAIEATR